MRHGGQILADQLRIQGVERVFSVPGESFLAALDGLYDSGIQNVVCRQEGGAAMMAEAHGKLTGRPGVLFVTRGPGATNASSGIHVAMQDSTPMVVFVGQIARGHRDREAFQEVNYRAMFGTMVKWVAEVDQTDRLPEYIARAFHTAMSGRPGPVVLALPEDMLSATADVADRPAVGRAEQAPSSAEVTQIIDRLAAAKRPLIIAGGSRWSQDAADALASFATASDIPVTVPFRRQGHLDNRSDVYAGDLGVGMNPALAKRLTQADCILALGTRLPDIATGGYELLDPQHPGPDIIHVHPDPDMMGAVYPAALEVCADPILSAQALAEAQNGPRPDREGWTASARADYLEWQRPDDLPGDLHMAHVIRYLSDFLPEDAILTNGAGNYAAFLHRHFTFKRYGTQLAPTSGSMGYGLPGAIAAKLEHPDRAVIALAGDGCFQMTCNELSTACQHGANVVIIVANNGFYGTIRMHQEGTYPARVSGTDLYNPDFAALARSYGGHGETVEADAGFAPALERALASGKPAVIELKLDPQALTTRATLDQVRAAGQAKVSE